MAQGFSQQHNCISGKSLFWGVALRLTTVGGKVCAPIPGHLAGVAGSSKNTTCYALDVLLRFIFMRMCWWDMKGRTLLINERQPAAKILMSHSWLLVWRVGMCTNYIMMKHPHWHVTTLLSVQRVQLAKSIYRKNESVNKLIHQNKVNCKNTNGCHKQQLSPPWAMTVTHKTRSPVTLLLPAVVKC